jgi:hypothetical protein
LRPRHVGAIVGCGRDRLNNRHSALWSRRGRGGSRSRILEGGHKAEVDKNREEIIKKLEQNQINKHPKQSIKNCENMLKKNLVK